MSIVPINDGGDGGDDGGDGVGDYHPQSDFVYGMIEIVMVAKIWKSLLWSVFAVVVPPFLDFLSSNGQSLKSAHFVDLAELVRPFQDIVWHWGWWSQSAKQSRGNECFRYNSLA